MDRNYYAVIPAEIRYDNSISASAKLLYGELTALSNDKGYCWASNEYFAELYETTDRTIRRWLAELKDAGHIYLEDESTSRKIYIRADKNVHLGRTKMSEGADKNVRQNNTNNITEDNKYFEDTNLDKAFADYVEYKDQLGKPMTAIGIEKEKEKLMKLSNCNIQKAIQILNTTIENGWKNLYDTKPVTRTPAKNFTEREYDWEALENKLF